MFTLNNPMNNSRLDVYIDNYFYRIRVHELLYNLYIKTRIKILCMYVFSMHNYHMANGVLPF